MGSLKLMTLILTFLNTSDGKKSVKEKTNVMNKTTTTCEEGEDTNARIYRAEVSPKNRFPYHIEILLHFEWDVYEMKHRCAGVLISKKHILTNAHCFFM